MAGMMRRAHGVGHRGQRCRSSATCRWARRRQPRIISWISNAINTTSTAAKISEPTSVGVFMPGLFPSRAVTLPRSSVAVTVAGKVIDSYGVLADRLASSAPATVQVASGSTTVRLAGSPTSSGRPWSGRPTMRAGFSLITRATSRQFSRPGSTMVCDHHRQRRLQTRACRAGPRRTRTHFSCSACGAWSVATQSITPSASA